MKAKTIVMVIAGPTAGGKSALAVALALALRRRQRTVCVINADAQQVYADLPILSGQPDAAERRDICHFLYGCMSPPQINSAGSWLTAVHRILDTDAAVGKDRIVTAADRADTTVREAVGASATGQPRGVQIAIVTGGTGLYLKALRQGLIRLPVVARAVIDQAGADVAADMAACRDELARAAQPAPVDRQRLIRALSVFRATGRGLSSWMRADAAGAVTVFRTVHVIPDAVRTEAAIRQRVKKQLLQDVVSEVRRFAERYPDLQALAGRKPPAHPILATIGLHPLLRYLGGHCDLGTATEAIVVQSRRYAKRQRTWFRHQSTADLTISHCVTAAEAQGHARQVLEAIKL